MSETGETQKLGDIEAFKASEEQHLARLREANPERTKQVQVLEKTQLVM